MKIQLNREIQGSILDVGGGGEGIISMMYPDQVVVNFQLGGHFYQKWRKL